MSKEDDLQTAIEDAAYFVSLARSQASGDIDGKDLEDARSELTNASNAIDDAMGIIDQMLAPDRTVWDDPHLD